MNEKTIESITKLQAEIREIYESPVTSCLGKDHYITKDPTVEKCAASTSLKDEIQGIVTKQKEKSGDEKLRESEAHFVDLDQRRVNLHGSGDKLGVPKLKEIIGTAPLLITQNETHSSLHSQGNSSDVNYYEKIPPQAGQTETMFKYRILCK
jgi:phage tail sheath protein FI